MRNEEVRHGSGPSLGRETPIPCLKHDREQAGDDRDCSSLPWHGEGVNRFGDALAVGNPPPTI